ncbi:MAG: hypothetical protein KA974_02535 [Saprospiraceae bacterium]|nr:hypothetical protein [Saprospiraceae bacterium]MBP7680055.1 hypothetical protein [Saprospiraceae bacterium]
MLKIFTYTIGVREEDMNAHCDELLPKVIKWRKYIGSHQYVGDSYWEPGTAVFNYIIFDDTEK